LGIDENKISVIQHSFHFPKYNTERNWPDLPEDFFLFVGKRRNYKNFNFFIESSAEQLKEIALVVVGSPFTDEEDALIDKLGIRDNVFQVSADDEELASLYAKANYFVFPSLAEGFGIPILEAYNSNCPVIISDISVFREVAEDAALYFDPTCSESIAKAMNEAITTGSIRKNLVDKGQERLEFFKNQNYTDLMQKAYKKAIEV
jgi:glycosyltransferase involved in cell wall biosynthesis